MFVYNFLFCRREGMNDAESTCIKKLPKHQEIPFSYLHAICLSMDFLQNQDTLSQLDTPPMQAMRVYPFLSHSARTIDPVNPSVRPQPNCSSSPPNAKGGSQPPYPSPIYPPYRYQSPSTLIILGITPQWYYRSCPLYLPSTGTTTVISSGRQNFAWYTHTTTPFTHT